MAVKPVEYEKFAVPEQLACHIANSYQQWKSARSTWESEKEELRQYVFARDTSTTSNASLPWKNKTTLPKLCQIRDNLHANYMAALFPRDDWFEWVAGDDNSATKEKAKAITTYMKSKLRSSDFRSEVSKLVYDYIDFGNAFAEAIYERKYHKDPQGNDLKVYVGPKVQRVSPYDLVFDITAPTFDEAAKITRRMLTMGEIKREADAGKEWAIKAFSEAVSIRKSFQASGYPDIKKYSGFALEGLGNITDYYKGTLVEVLEFEGDAFDPETGNLFAGHRVIVIDRRCVVYNKPFESWLGRSNKKHTGWRPRPESLLAMGPLDNLVGMQYRVDHLENLKADVFDQIAHPVVYQKGHVEDWDWGPGARIYGDSESDVTVLNTGAATALNADMQIAQLLNLMEEMAGAPRQAMGIRTPGEKTAYEVQVLENGAGRIFQNKVTHFESTFLEPLLNDMLEAARRNMDVAELVAVQDTDLGVTEFQNVSAEDIKANGKLVPMGARHYAEIAVKIQNLNAFMASPAYADPSVKAHFSSLAIANQIGELLKLSDGTVREGVRIMEDAKLAQLSQAAQAVVGDNAAAGAVAAQADAGTGPVPMV